MLLFLPLLQAAFEHILILFDWDFEGLQVTWARTCSLHGELSGSSSTTAVTGLETRPGCKLLEDNNPGRSCEAHVSLTWASTLNIHKAVWWQGTTCMGAAVGTESRNMKIQKYP